MLLPNILSSKLKVPSCEVQSFMEDSTHKNKNKKEEEEGFEIVNNIQGGFSINVNLREKGRRQ